MAWQDELEREGFAIMAGILDDAEVARIVRALEEVRTADAVLERGGRVYAMRNLFHEVPETRRLAESDAVRRWVEPVLGPGAFAVRGLLFDKTPEANWAVPWHQDMTIAVKFRREVHGYGPWTTKAGVPHVQPPAEVLERMLSVRLQLDEAGPNQGPVRVVPGSHRHGKLGVGGTRDWLARTQAQPCVVPRGGGLLMRPLLLHASSPADAPGHRRVVHLEYAAGELDGGLEWYEAYGPGLRRLVS